MKRMAAVLVLAVLLKAFDLFPFAGGKIADLQPVQVLVVEQHPQSVAVHTDNGLAGVGATYGEAMAVLERTAMGRAFFAACSAVVLCGEGSLDAVLADSRLRPAAMVYAASVAPNAAQLQPVLSAHPGGVRIADLQRGAGVIPMLEGWLKDGA